MHHHCTLFCKEMQVIKIPSKKLTELGGEFPYWSAGGKKIHWSLGKGHFVFNLDALSDDKTWLRLAR